MGHGRRSHVLKLVMSGAETRMISYTAPTTYVYSVHSLRSGFDDRPYRCQKRGLEMDWSPLVSLDR